MTEPNDFDQDEALLPGLEEPATHQGANEDAARRTIRSLAKAELIGEPHAVMCEALLTAARQLDRAAGSSRSKDYGVANLLAQLRETYLVLLPEKQEGGGRSAWDEFLDELAGARRGTPAVRDPAES